MKQEIEIAVYGSADLCADLVLELAEQGFNIKAAICENSGLVNADRQLSAVESSNE